MLSDWALITALALGAAQPREAPPPDATSARQLRDLRDQIDRASRNGDNAAIGELEKSVTVIEARIFMSDYATLLRLRDRAGLANLYNREGAWRVGEGQSQLESWRSIRDNYRRRWQPPASFEWQDLAFEPLGADSAVVTGRFSWGYSDGRSPRACSYTGLLVRQQGELRIRLEDESCAPN